LQKRGEIKLKAPSKQHYARLFYSSLFVLLLSSCAVLNSNFKKPEVSVINLYALPGEGIEQRFKVILQITNPNPTALKLAGMSYGLNLNGYKIVSGVVSSIPEIPAYGQNEVELVAAVNALAGIRFLSSLLATPQSAFNYRFYADLDTGMPWLGSILVEDGGEITLSRNP